MKALQCPKCSDYAPRLVRSNDGEPWMCPDCYIGLNVFPTPQTQWPDSITTKELLTLEEIAERYDEVIIVCPRCTNIMPCACNQCKK